MQAVSRLQAKQIDRERAQHSKLGNLFTTAFTVNLVLFLIAAYCLVNLVDSFSKMESQAVYDPFAVGGGMGVGGACWWWLAVAVAPPRHRGLVQPRGGLCGQQCCRDAACLRW
jgi:hypothetical protein